MPVAFKLTNQFLLIGKKFILPKAKVIEWSESFTHIEGNLLSRLGCCLQQGFRFELLIEKLIVGALTIKIPSNSTNGVLRSDKSMVAS